MEISYCGLCCDNCFRRAVVGPNAEALVHSLKRAGFKRFENTLQNFNAFWELLSDLAERGGCQGCKAGDGDPECSIRLCAIEKNLDSCAYCNVYACQEFREAHLTYKTLENDNRYLKKNGLAAWEIMQEVRRGRGFNYLDNGEDQT